MNSKSILVAEIGINHNGSVEKAIRLCDIAKRSGFDYVKFQKRNPDKCVPKSEWGKIKETPWGTREPYIEYKRKIEFGGEEFKTIEAHCENTGIKWFMSVWDSDSVEFASGFNCDFIKIPSAMLTNTNLIKSAINTGKTVVISTGMSTVEEIDTAVSLFGADHRTELVLMHCHSTYPQPQEETNLMAIKTLRERYGTKVGYSSHDVSPYSSIMAMWRYDAHMIEVHVCESRADPGSDMAASLEEPALRLIARERDRLATIDGNGEIKLWDSELKSRNHLRRL